MLQIDTESFVFDSRAEEYRGLRGELISHNKIKRVIYILINCFIPRAMRNDDEEEEENKIQFFPRESFSFHSSAKKILSTRRIFNQTRHDIVSIVCRSS